jgi:predicted dehydrogenase
MTQPLNSRFSSSVASGSRRDFLTQSLAAGAVALPTIVSARALGLEQAAAASERITLGAIGVGGRCRGVLKAMMSLPDVQCVALADVQAVRRDMGKALVDEKYGTKDCVIYHDFRELLARQDIDAVVIATGDRWHGPASMMAAEAGKDVYSEKPCGMTIEICQRIAETFKKTGRIFQAGTQRRSAPHFAAARQLAQSGKLGKITQLNASVYAPILGNDWLPAEPTPPKEICDWGAHTVDLCQWANGSDDTTPLTFEPTDKGIECRYANGVLLFLDFLATPFGDRGPNWNTALGTCPVKYIGEEGWVETGDACRIDLANESLRAEVAGQENAGKGKDVILHSRNFIDSIKSRQPTVCNADVMRKSHIACHAAATAWILGRKLSFDPAREVFITAEGGLDDEANLMRSRPERDPWA